MTGNGPSEVLHPSAWAASDPDRPALVMSPAGEVRAYADLEAGSIRLARLLAARGLGKGDTVAVLTENRPEFFDAVWAGLRSGLYVTPVSSHLTAAEAGYIIADCGARALVASAGLAEVVAGLSADLDGVETRLSVGGGIHGFEPYETAVAAIEADPDGSHGPEPEACEGTWMFYSSGTTGRPKGIVPPLPGGHLGAPSPFTALLTGLYGFDAETVYLSPAPLYHAMPAGWTTGTQRLGGTAVVMERFDPVELLAAIEAHRVTHVGLVPTHLMRLMELSATERDRFDLSSLRMVIHAAAPCPVEVKRAAMDWLGPIIYEFYSGSEGAGFCAIGPEEWLAHPGSVGRSMLGTVHITDGEGTELATGTEGQVFFETDRPFEYRGDPDKTAAAFDGRGWATIGDVGWVDEEGYLYLTDRASDLIISGGVNIYPREIEDLLLGHPAVADVAVVGTPDADMGEAVTAFVKPAAISAPGDDDLADELIAHCRERLSHIKCPRSVRFVDELPRLPTGKLLKRHLAP